MLEQQAVSQNETDNAQEPLDFNTETLQDLDVTDSENVKGGANVGVITSLNPSGGRLSGTSVIVPGAYVGIGS
jgi:hypothetical protein